MSAARACLIVLRRFLKESRTEYGEGIVSILSRQLQLKYGRGFAAKNLRHMIRFTEVFADKAIVSALWRQLSWVASGTSYKHPYLYDRSWDD